MSAPQMKEGPASSMLRAMFAGFGSLMSVMDRVRNKPAAEAPADTEAPAAATTPAPEDAAATKDTATPEQIRTGRSARIPNGDPAIRCSGCPQLYSQRRF